MLSNAAKFTKKGKITMLIEKIGNKNIKFDIKDTGIGMNEEQLKNVFEEFTQAESSTSKDYGVSTSTAIASRCSFIDYVCCI